MQTGTAFDKMPNDFDASPTPRSATAVHPFEAKGLGKAPFNCYSVDDHGGRCAYCGTRIKYQFHIRSKDSAEHVVGSECVLKTAAQLLGFVEQNAQLRRRLADTKRATAKAKKAAVLDERRQEFMKNYAVEMDWIKQAALRGFDFARSLEQAVAQWGSLTGGQLGAVQRCMARELDRKAANEERKAAAPVVNIARIEEAFAKAKANKVRYPRLRLGDFVFTPAGAASNNAGAVYVKTQPTRAEKAEGAEGQYLGKVMGGKFLRVRDCTPAQELSIVTLASDPAAAAVAYGKRLGECAVCGKTLENSESIDRGIGPICAGKYGW